jgi:hypothetical protein
MVVDRGKKNPQLHAIRGNAQIIGEDADSLTSPTEPGGIRLPPVVRDEGQEKILAIVALSNHQRYLFHRSARSPGPTGLVRH